VSDVAVLVDALRRVSEDECVLDSERTVEAVTAAVFRKLQIDPSPDVNRRVLMVLTLLRS
jgi:hypothetical protein